MNKKKLKNFGIFFMIYYNFLLPGLDKLHHKMISD